MKQSGSNKKKKKVNWPDDVPITVGAETACNTATQHACIFATTDNTQIPITSARPDETETTPAVVQCRAPHMPAPITSVFLNEATQKVRTGQTLNSPESPTTQTTCQEVPDYVPTPEPSLDVTGRGNSTTTTIGTIMQMNQAIGF